MGLIAILLIILISIFILTNKKTKNRNDSKESKSGFTTYNILTGLVLIMAISQGPFFYYYTFGFFGFIIGAPYVLIGLILTIILIYPLHKNKKTSNFHKKGTTIAILIGMISLFFGSTITEKLDWKLRMNERKSIINKIADGDIKDYKAKMNNFPPISNGGNEIIVDKRENENNMTVTFYIDRGFVDHYSAYIYSTDSTTIRDLEEKIEHRNNKTNKKLKDNWYRIAE